MSKAVNELLAVARWQEAHTRMTKNSIATIIGSLGSVSTKGFAFKQAAHSRNPISMFAAATVLLGEINSLQAQAQFLSALLAVLAETNGNEAAWDDGEVSKEAQTPVAEAAGMTEVAVDGMENPDLHESMPQLQDEGRGEPEQDEEVNDVT